MEEKDCPQHCRNDRANIQRQIQELKDDRHDRWEKADCKFRKAVTVTTMKWVLGIMIIIACSTLGIIYSGQTHNSDMILDANKVFAEEISKMSHEINQLRVIITRIDERTKTTQKKLDAHSLNNRKDG